MTTFLTPYIHAYIIGDDDFDKQKTIAASRTGLNALQHAYTNAMLTKENSEEAIKNFETEVYSQLSKSTINSEAARHAFSVLLLFYLSEMRNTLKEIKEGAVQVFSMHIASHLQHMETIQSFLAYLYDYNKQSAHVNTFYGNNHPDKKPQEEFGKREKDCGIITKVIQEGCCGGFEPRIEEYYVCDLNKPEQMKLFFTSGAPRSDTTPLFMYLRKEVDKIKKNRNTLEGEVKTSVEESIKGL